MPTGTKVFLAMPDACELRPCDRTHLTNCLVPDFYVGGTYDKYPDVTGSVLYFRLFYFLSVSRTLSGAAEPVNVVIFVYSAC